MPLFAPFEVALENFYGAGGAHVTAIRTPVTLMKEFLKACPEGSSDAYYLNSPIEPVATQNYVSIRGRTVTGADLEIPVPS
jgi:hypothetical protein